MKKILSIVFAVAFIACLSTSCNKNCVCTTTTDGVAVTVDHGELTKDQCNALDATGQLTTALQTNVTVSCK